MGRKWTDADFGGTLIWGITNDDEIVGLEDVESDAEFISETIKTKIDSIPKVNLRFHMEDNKKLILLDVYAGKEKHITMWARGI